MLEEELEAKLDRAIATRSDNRIPDIDVWRGTSAAENTTRDVACALRIGVGEGGVIEDVENLRAKLSTQPLPLDRKVLDQREIPIPKG